MRLIYSLIIIVSAAYGNAAEFKKLTDLKISAEAPVCFADDCYLHIYFEGYENLDPEVSSSQGNFPACGYLREKSVLGNDQVGVRGSTRLVLTLRDSKGISRKFCSLEYLPTSDSSGKSPRAVFQYPKDKLPNNINVRLRDRLTQEYITAKVTVPPPTSVDKLKCADGNFQKLYEGQTQLRNVRFDLHRVYTYCFNIQTRSSDRARGYYFSISSVNKGNTQCSDVKVKAISPSGKEYYSNGSQPGVSPLTEQGEWKFQTFLAEGCDTYDFNAVY